jgi:hypothetical protein
MHWEERSSNVQSFQLDPISGHYAVAKRGACLEERLRDFEHPPKLRRISWTEPDHIGIAPLQAFKYRIAELVDRCAVCGARTGEGGSDRRRNQFHDAEGVSWSA